MRFFLLFLLAPLLLPVQSAAQTFDVTERVSDVTNVQRIVSADLRPLPTRSYEGSHASFRAVYEDDPEAGASWSLVLFGYTSDTTAMSRTPDVHLRADDVQLKPTRIGSETRELNSTLLEVKRLSLKRSHFEQVARADTVTVFIGPVQFKMERVLRTDLRLILDRVSTAPAKQAAENDSDSSTTQNNKGDA